MKKEVYMLVHDTNSAVGQIASTSQYLQRVYNDGKLSQEDFEKIVEWLRIGKDNFKLAVDNYYKTLKKDE